MVQLVVPLEVMGDRYEKEHKNDKEFDQVEWKKFWKQHQKYQTLCLDCIGLNKEEERKKRMKGGMVGGFHSDSDGDPGGGTDFGPVYLSAASHAIAQLWYRKAQDRIFGSTGRRRKQVVISDDEDEIHDSKGKEHWSQRKVTLNAASKAQLIKWVRIAQQPAEKRRQSKSTRTTEESRGALEP